MIFIKRYQINRLLKKLKALQHNRQHNQSSTDALIKERALYHKLAAMYQSLQGSKKYPYAHVMVKACYRASAQIEDLEAQYLLGKMLLEEARFYQSLQKNPVFANSMQQRDMKALFEEGLLYLVSADKMQHIQAKRLLGLAYINGWGMEADKDKGFDLVVSSIELENSWDKVPQIFASIGLNKPEFFQALSQRRK